MDLDIYNPITNGDTNLRLVEPIGAGAVGNVYKVPFHPGLIDFVAAKFEN